MKKIFHKQLQKFLVHELSQMKDFNYIGNHQFCLALIKDMYCKIIISSTALPHFKRHSVLSNIKFGKWHIMYPMWLPKLYIPSTLNIDLILWQTQLIVFAENVKSWFKSWVISFTFQAYSLPHTLNCISLSLFKLHTVHGPL